MRVRVTAGAGRIAASRIEPIAPQALGQLNGLVRQIDADTLTVDGTRIRLESPQMATGLALGREVLVSGEWDGASARAALATGTHAQQPGRVEQVVLEGYIHSLGGREFSLRLAPYPEPDVQSVGGSTATCGQPAVQISGRVGADPRVKVDRIEFRNSASGAGRDATPELKRSADAADDKGGSSGKGSSDDKGASGSSGSSDGAASSGSTGSSGSSGGLGLAVASEAL